MGEVADYYYYADWAEIAEDHLDRENEFERMFVRAERRWAAEGRRAALDRNDVWVTGTGEEIHYSKLKLRHLLNCILMLERRLRTAQGPMWEIAAEEDVTLQRLVDESMRRGLALPHIFGRA